MAARFKVEFTLGKLTKIEHELELLPQLRLRVRSRENFLNRFLAGENLVLPRGGLAVIANAAAAGDEGRYGTIQHHSPAKSAALPGMDWSRLRHVDAFVTPRRPIWQTRGAKKLRRSRKEEEQPNWSREASWWGET